MMTMCDGNGDDDDNYNDISFKTLRFNKMKIIMN